MKDNITNWYKKIKVKKAPHDKHWNSHYIENCSMIALLGGSNCGKTNSILDFLNRKNETFYRIVIFTSSTSDEPLYNYLQSIIDVEMYTDIEELPTLQEISDDDDNKREKIIIFDDFINLPNQKMKKIRDYAIGSRKKGWTCCFLCHNYSSLDKIIARSIHYWWIFRLNDNVSIDRVIKNHNISSIDKSVIKKAYLESTKITPSFFMIDMKTDDDDMKYRHNFTDFLPLK
jgi:hypothetical protein